MLPYEGNLLEQPNDAMVKFETIMTILAEMEEADMKREESQRRLDATVPKK